MKVRPAFKQERNEGGNEDGNKKWYDAFLEYYKDGASYKKQSAADAIQIDDAGNCTQYQALIAYVIQFTNGGFWLVDGIVYVVTAGVASDIDATYEDAIEFIKNWN